MPRPIHAQHISTNINENIRKQWIREASAFLKTVKPEPPAMEIAVFDLTHFEKNQLKCSIRMHTYLRINDRDWIYFIVQSAHSNPDVGDVILAIDQDGVIYSCEAHVCSGSTSVRSDDLIQPVSSEDFFARFHSYGMITAHWIKRNSEDE